MASEDILPTYEEVMKTYQTPAHVLRFEARTITYAEESSVSKIKSFLARPDHSHTDDVQVKKTRKSKVAEVLVKVLTGMFKRHTIAIVFMTNLFESSNPEALLDCLEYFEESGSGKTVTLPLFSTKIVFNILSSTGFDFHANVNARNRPDHVTRSLDLPSIGMSSPLRSDPDHQTDCCITL